MRALGHVGLLWAAVMGGVRLSSAAADNVGDVWIEGFRSQTSETNQNRHVLRFRPPADVSFTVSTATLAGGIPRMDWAAPHYDYTGVRTVDSTNWVQTLYEASGVRVRSWHWSEAPYRFNLMSATAPDRAASGCQMVEREQWDAVAGDWTPVLRLYGDGTVELHPLMAPQSLAMPPTGGPLVLGPVYTDSAMPIAIDYDPALDAFLVDYRHVGRLSAWPGHRACVTIRGITSTGACVRADMRLPYEGVGCAAWLTSRFHDTNQAGDTLHWEWPRAVAQATAANSVWATQAVSMAITIPSAVDAAPAATVSIGDIDTVPADPGTPSWTRFGGLTAGDWTIVEAWGQQLAFCRSAPALWVAAASVGPVFQPADSNVNWNVIRGGYYQSYRSTIYAACVLNSMGRERLFIATSGGVGEIQLQNGQAALTMVWPWNWDPVYSLAVVGERLLFYVSSFGSQSGWHLLDPSSGTHEFRHWSDAEPRFDGLRPVDTLLGPTLVDDMNPVPLLQSYGVSPDGSRTNSTPYVGPSSLPLQHSMYRACRGDVGTSILDNYVGLMWGWAPGPLRSLGVPLAANATTLFYCRSTGLLISGNHEALYSSVLPPTVRIDSMAAMPVVTWERGELECARASTGPWEAMSAAASPHVVGRDADVQFFRVRQVHSGP